MEDSEMHDVIEALGALRGTGEQTPPTPDTVASDLDRGRRALTGRRRRRAARAGFATAVVVTAVTVAVVTRPGDGGADAATRQAAHAPVSAAAPHALQLVAYTGVQPSGFRVDTVPAGWTVSSSDTTSFVAVPPGTHVHQSPGDVDLAAGIAVSLQGDEQFAPGTTVTTVAVNGRPGRLALTSDRTAKWLIFPDAKGHKVVVQALVTLGVSDDQLVRFAEGITVTGEAQVAVG